MVESDYCRVNSDTGTSQLEGYFCFDTVFNVRKKVLIEAEIRVLEKGLDYAHIQNKINELELSSDLEKFCRRMRLKWYFRNEPTSDFTNVSSLTLKSSLKPP